MDKKKLDIAKILARNIHDQRVKQNLTQLQLAEAANVTPLSVSNIERAESWPKAETLEALAQALQVRPYELFIDTDVDAVISKERFNTEIDLIVNDLHAMRKNMADDSELELKKNPQPDFSITHPKA